MQNIAIFCYVRRAVLGLRVKMGGQLYQHCQVSPHFEYLKVVHCYGATGSATGVVLVVELFHSGRMGVNGGLMEIK